MEPHKKNSPNLHVLLRSLLLGAFLTAVGGSPDTSAQNAREKANTPTSEAPPKVEPVHPTSQGYRLAPNDTVQIHVFQEDELETTAKISKDGAIPFPLLGTIQIGGRTIPEASTLLTQALREYLVRPQVALRIIEYSKRRITVLGQVNRPGTFDLPDEVSISLLEGIGLAGGYSRIANPSKVTVKRRTPQGEMVFQLDAQQMANNRKAPAFQLQAGDTIVVKESLF